MTGWDYAIAAVLAYGLGVTFAADIFWDAVQEDAAHGDEEAARVCQSRMRPWVWLITHGWVVVLAGTAAGIADRAWDRLTRRAK